MKQSLFESDYEKAVSLQNILVDQATGGTPSDAMYRRLGQALVTKSTIKKKVPEFGENPAHTPEVTGDAGTKSLPSRHQCYAQITAQVAEFCMETKTAKEIMGKVGLRHWKTFQMNNLNPLFEVGLLERTIPDKPSSSKQKYRLTQKGKEMLESNRG